jgi:cytochrome P450
VHFCDSPLYGPDWSVTRYRDIMTVDTSHQTYSSDAAFGGVTLKDVPLQYRRESFIAMDPPGHDEQPIVASPNLAKMSSTIRERAIRILEGLPRGEIFDCRLRFDRADDADAVDLVRLPVRGAADPDPLVQCQHGQHVRRDRD